MPSHGGEKEKAVNSLFEPKKRVDGPGRSASEKIAAHEYIASQMAM